MLRIIAGVVVGWLVMTVIVVAVFGITPMVLGLEQTFQPGSYWTTNTFNIIVLAGGFIAAIIGGLVCASIARKSNAAVALAVIVLALGMVSAAMNMNKPDPPARSGELTFEDIATHAKEPNWFAFGSPVIAAVGIMIGSRLTSGKAAN